ncbi:CDP-glucose 4,6-dehydratase [Gammaproteobacteria bacterium]|nr:CDP-glucose 4,6-dehydratase [Gammaproteobacteria bacterium]
MAIQNIFENKKVLVTGHTGFKGSWLVSWLKLLNANVSGIALDPYTDPSHFSSAKISEDIEDLRIDIRDGEALKKAIKSIKPDFIFHLAAQALVRKSYTNPIETWQTNVFGTINLLDALRDLDNECTAVMITSDKCYDNVEWIWGYRETDALGGPDPYSASKGAAELAIKSYIKSYFPKESSNIRLASARAGNVIGGGDWSQDRIVPDCIKAWMNNSNVELRNPHATRPWQHVLEPLSGYLCLAEHLSQDSTFHGEPFNFGPPAEQNHSVLNLVENMSLNWKNVQWTDISENISGPYESGLLKLNCDKALAHLNWQPTWNFEETVKITTEWYKSFHENPNEIKKITEAQIKEYLKSAKEKNIGWSK